MPKRSLLVSLVSISLLYVPACKKGSYGQTEITRWQYGKKGAVSITYDDGNRNQFKYALPIMERIKLPATFFIITGPISGSHYRGKFIGRPVKKVIRETAQTPTNAHNFFERASAARYLGYAGTEDYYNKADGLYESGKMADAYKIIDELYKQVRSGRLKPGKDTSMEISDEKGLSWDNIKKYAAEGYEFASHTVTHAHLAVLDTANMFYELKKSKQDIADHLGVKYTFSAEVPFGIDDPRVMKYALPVYPALRNLMTDPYMKEINRGYKDQPGASDQTYVQWQRGPITKTPMSLMKSWIDTTLAHDNIWLVLVFHGVDDLGWEALPHEFLKKYFQYIRKHEDHLWVATFGDVARYMRERMHAKVQVSEENNMIVVTLSQSLDKKMYDLPLTLKTDVPPEWKAVLVRQGNKVQKIDVGNDGTSTFILYQAQPNGLPLELSKIPG